MAGYRPVLDSSQAPTITRPKGRSGLEIQKIERYVSELAHCVDIRIASLTPEEKLSFQQLKLVHGILSTDRERKQQIQAMMKSSWGNGSFAPDTVGDYFLGSGINHCVAGDYGRCIHNVAKYVPGGEMQWISARSDDNRLVVVNVPEGFQYFPERDASALKELGCERVKLIVAGKADEQEYSLGELTERCQGREGGNAFLVVVAIIVFIIVIACLFNFYFGEREPEKRRR